MSIYAISDLHLALGMNKPMSIFGDHWEDHADKIASNWNLRITEEDTVLIPGDISWGMSLEEAAPDLEFIHLLPGIKIITKGNHDYWWTTVGKIERFLDERGLTSIRILKNNCFRADTDTLICGTRGWILPDDPSFTEKDAVIFKRETGRLESSLKSAGSIRTENDRVIVMMHYPPLLSNIRSSAFTDIIRDHHADKCLYGHVHLKGFSKCVEGVHEGVVYVNISADKIAFKPLSV